jgi:hypothetical protein
VPVYEGLLLHYDASLIDKSDSYEFDNVNNRLLRWINAGQLAVTPNTPPTNKPTIESFEYGEDSLKHTLGVTRSSMSTSQTLTSSKTNPQLSAQNLTVYLVTNFDSINGTGDGINILHSRSNNSNNRNKFILKTSTSSLSSGQLELVRYSGNGTSFTVTNQSNYRTDSWDIVKLELYATDDVDLAIRRDIQVNEGVFSYLSNAELSGSTNDNITLTPFSLSFAHGYAIGEVMVYNGITTPEDEQLILKYLYDKYYP